MCRILYIEDDATTRIAVRKSLEILGMTVDAVWNGEKGIEAAMNGSFECIVLDLMMPGMDGFQVIRMLKSQESTQQVPVVVLTARADEESRQQALEAGANSYVVKPYRIKELVKIIQELAEERRSALDK